VLTRIFEKYGEVIRSYSIRNPNGKSKGFGFVSFASSQIAQSIVRQGYIKTPDDTLIYCEAYQKNNGKEQSPEPLDPINGQFGARFSLQNGSS
jgi:hypothetical protein